jgi:hypothetical protein
LGEASAGRQHSGNEGGGHGAHARGEDAEFAFAGGYLVWFCHGLGRNDTEGVSLGLNRRSLGSKP